ncbi:pyridine nucleotide-disulfide oxidoreductase [Echinicola strongylocentroti]|uniref:Pyridine nucleotide-disulfide oxidoreductase n=1 Tax=Echinicola strongylocentroti TaxID=1795355 RepID=A0A2Z4IFX5_9BACT|nr:FAD-dependent oxidoreductase [Echinicola strongylocentroti]AWW29590.1 pyridine nucleotide-disulfide oxidoreductase [Echinicola strongylocentroti]
MSKTAVIIGASHAGVNCAFALRKEGFEGKIQLIESTDLLPYHRPPLSKSFLNEDKDIADYCLKSAEAYAEAKVELLLGRRVLHIDSQHHEVHLEGNHSIHYDYLVLATGASAVIPALPGMTVGEGIFPLRSAEDTLAIKSFLNAKSQLEVVVLGGGYIGLEMAASLRKMGHQITLLEREKRILARVAAAETSSFFTALHQESGVKIHTGQNISNIEHLHDGRYQLDSDTGDSFVADMVIVGVGVSPNTALAQNIGLTIENGILVDAHCETSTPDIFAIGDCASFIHQPSSKVIRLESVQNAVDQAKIAAANITGNPAVYNSIPWFWSDQYETKLQIAGLNHGYDQVVHRIEKEQPQKQAVWYFKEGKLLAVDAINHAKAYVLGTRYLKEARQLHPDELANPEIPLKK